MKITRYIAWILCAGVVSACGDSGPFYTAVYPVTKVEAVVTVKPTDPAPSTMRNRAEAGEIPDAQQIVETVTAEVLAQAPVAAGGRYTIDFTRHDGGVLTVVAAAGASPMRGTFDKQPGQGELLFSYNTLSYTGTIASYTDANKTKCVVLEVDLTEQYQQLHPDWNITAVTRREQTSARYK